MAAGVEATIDGLTTFVSTVGDAAEQLADLDQVNQDAADLVVVAVEAPRITGRLADTVKAVVDGAGFHLIAGGAQAPYALIVHARNPFLTRALNQRETDVIGLYEDHVDTSTNLIKGA